MPNVVFETGTGVSRDYLLGKFRESNIDARVFFYPLSSLPMFDAAPRTNGALTCLPGRSTFPPITT
jgi:perosamine synthetase